ncbi:MAG: putative glycoside hydrolase [Candidatus Campbellbacteria bacterium]|nr:putative glycoside hydrolase [Candidatus Campbellbacteria bacterium]
MNTAPQKKKVMPHAHKIVVGSLVTATILCVGFFVAPNVFSSTYTRMAERAEVLAEKIEKKEVPDVVHMPTPEPMKAIYMSQCVVGTPSFRDKLVVLIDETELNSVIIDVKDFSGKIGFTTDNPILAPAVSDACGARDMKAFIKTLHSKNIYVVARITVFQDPYYTSVHPELAVKKASDGSVWKDHKGLAFIDVGAKPFWEYIVELGRESYKIGFDELNLDYVRYPSDGNMKDIAFTFSKGVSKAEMLERFFSFFYESFATGETPTSGLRPSRRDSSDITRPALSVDLFGYTTTNTDDLGIGQVLERALPYFDFVMPMVYPSHYNSGFIGIAKPATSPYEVVKYSMDRSTQRARLLGAAEVSTATSTIMVFLREQSQKGHGNINAQQMRPWLQDFDMGATYTPEMVRAQMQATYDAGLTSWALWDAGNTYTRAALLNQ